MPVPVLSNVDGAAQVVSNATGLIVATNVQAALAELDSEKVAHSLADATGDLLVASTADTFTRLAKGSDFQILKSKSAATLDLAWADLYEPRNIIEIYDDFFSGLATSGLIGALGWGTTLSGTAASASIPNPPANVQGEITLSTGTTTTGRAAIFVAWLNALNTGDSFVMDWKVQIPVLSTAGEEFIVDVGIQNTTGPAAPASGFWFDYDRLNSANWRISVADGTTTSTTTTSTAVGTGYSRLSAVGTTSSIEFFVDGTSVGTISTNVPVNRITAPILRIRKSAGSTARTLFIDFFSLRYVLGSAR